MVKIAKGEEIYEYLGHKGLVTLFSGPITAHQLLATTNQGYPDSDYDLCYLY